MRGSRDIGNLIDGSSWWNPLMASYLLTATIIIEFLVVYLLGKYFGEKPPERYLFIWIAIANLITFIIGWALRLWL